MNFKEANTNNFFSLYDDIGQHAGVVDHQRQPGYSVVNSELSAWPNGVYRIDTGDARVIDEIYRSTSAYKTKPLIFSIDNESLDRGLRESSYHYYPIEQWPGMYIELSEIADMAPEAPETPEVAAEENDGYTTGLISGEAELTQWLALVSAQLFKGKRLAPEIFTWLLANGHALVTLREGNAIIGAALIYTDRSGVSGVYLVCIKETFRGKGMGKRLMKSCLHWVKAAKSKLCILQSTKAGIPLYTSLGFTATNSYKLFFQIK